MRVLAPITALIDKLIKHKFVKRDRNGMPQATARKDMVLKSHYEIVTFYNQRINGILNYYTFAGNRTGLRKIVLFLNLSCALTLALKFKLGTKRAAYKKFGKLLEDKQTGVGLKLPKTLVAIHDYKGFKSKTIEAEQMPDKVLAQSWFNKYTEPLMGRGCTLCHSKTEVEMHHLRTVKDVKAKIRTGDSTYAKWTGLFLRKQIPLCKYHHQLYHAGQLTAADLKELRRYAPKTPK